MERRGDTARPQAPRAATLLRALALLAAGTLAVCGVKAPPLPPQQDAPARAPAGAPDAGPAAPEAGAAAPDAGPAAPEAPAAAPDGGAAEGPAPAPPSAAAPPLPDAPAAQPR